MNALLGAAFDSPSPRPQVVGRLDLAGGDPALHQRTGCR